MGLITHFFYDSMRKENAVKLIVFVNSRDNDYNRIWNACEILNGHENIDPNIF